MKRVLSVIVALALTAALMGMSAIAGWQRGGHQMEQWLWVLAACCLTVCVHILPSLISARSVVARLVWVGAFVACVFGHSQFFVFSELHAGEARISTSVDAVQPIGRSPTVIAQEVARATRVLARLPADSRDYQAKVVAALEQELKVAQEQSAAIRNNQIRNERDPVGARIAAVTGFSHEAIMLVVAVATAVILEGLAVTFWGLALAGKRDQRTENRSAECIEDGTSADTRCVLGQRTNNPQMKLDLNIPSYQVTEFSITREVNGDRAQRCLVESTNLPTDEEEALKVIAAVRNGEIRATVTNIRGYLRCSQSKALAMRRLVVSA
jgi:hypothetical protein